MTDWLTPQQRSHNMASIRSRGNATTEAALAALLRSARIAGWRRHSALPGRPDFVFHAQRLAVFVDGCFWHGCPRCYRMPGDNRPYWSAKVAGNRRRDRRAGAALRAAGWRVLRIWEHSLKTAAGRARAAARVQRALAAAPAELSLAAAEPAPGGRYRARSRRSRAAR
jgi:DNA mismatch endonuclease, patch repair protein